MIEAAANAASAGNISDKASKTLADFAENIKRWQSLSQGLTVCELLELVLTESGYLRSLEDEASQSKDEVLIGRVENVHELIAVAREFESVADQSNLESFLTRISLVSDLDSLELTDDAVKLMTIHSAKGLEFSTVFLLGLEEGLFPHIRSINSPSALEEERRLMYVGVTRAKDRLYLTYSHKRMIFGGGGSASTNYTIPSRFLNEIDPEYLSGFSSTNTASEQRQQATRFDESQTRYTT